MRQYVSPGGLFRLTVPAAYMPRTGKDKKSRTVIPVCHEGSLVCVEVPKTLYRGTNFGDASVEVTLMNAKTQVACESPGRVPDSGSPDAKTFPEFEVDPRHPTRLIDGTRFVRALPGGGAAAGHESETYRYRGFKNGRCYDLTMQITYTGFAAYQPGTMQEFTKREKAALIEELTQILQTFKALR